MDLSPRRTTMFMSACRSNDVTDRLALARLLLLMIALRRRFKHPLRPASLQC